MSIPSLLSEVAPATHRRQRRVSGAAVFALSAVGLIVLLALAAPWLAPYPPQQMDLSAVSRPPSLTGGHLLGTDTFGRDVLSRTLWGGRAPLLIATISVLVGLFVGVLLGTIAGYAGGIVDLLLARLADIQLSIPGLVLALVFLSLFGTSPINVVVIIGIESWPLYFRVIRAQVREIRSRSYIEAAKLARVGPLRMLTRHVLPNSTAVLIVAVTVNFTSAVLAESSLSFLGLGIQPPTPDWGVMIAEGQSQLASAPWLSLVPGSLLVCLLLAFQVLADDLSRRHALRGLTIEGAV